MFSASNSVDYFKDIKIASRNGRSFAVSIEDLCEVLGKLGITGPRHLKYPGLGVTGILIGEGAQFDVFRDRLWDNKVEVIKRVKPIFCPSSTSVPETSLALSVHLQTLKLEISSLGNVRRRQHPNIARLIGWGYDYPTFDRVDRLPVLFMERADYTLLDLLAPGSDTQARLTPASQHHICLDVAAGLACVHSTGLVHGDIKPENILIFADDNPKTPWIAKLSDFGSCIDLGTKSISLESYRGTYGWQPPEVIHSAQNSRQAESTADLLTKADSFVFGLLVLSVFVTEGRSLLLCDASTSVDGPVQKALSVLSRCSLDMPIKTMLQRLCRDLLQQDAHLRSEVSFDIVAAEVQSYKDWTLRNVMTVLGDDSPTAQPFPAPALSKSYLEYWMSFDTATRQILERRWDESNRGGKKHHFSAQTLFGMALGFASHRHLGYQAKALKFARAAAQAGSMPARGIVWQLDEAISEGSERSDTDSRQMLEWLYDATSTGSYTAYQRLAQLDEERARDARQEFMVSGGYNPEGFTLPQSLSSIQIGDSPDPDLIIDEFANRLLHAAAVAGDTNAIRKLLDINADNNVGNGAGETPLYKACLSARCESIELLLKLNANATVRVGEYGITCLHWLFNFGEDHIHRVAQLLISHGADPNARLKDLTMYSNRRHIPWEHFPFHWPAGTPLHWACATSSLRAAAVLLEHGAHVDQTDSEDNDGLTALQIALFNGNADVTEFLIYRGADCTRLHPTRGISGLHLMAWGASSLRKLFRSPRSLTWWVTHGSWSYHVEILRRCVRAAVGGGLDINHRVRGLSKQTPALEAAGEEEGGPLLALLREECSTDAVEGICCNTLLHLWAGRDRRVQSYPEALTQVWKALLLRSNDITSMNNQGETPVHMAVQSPNEEDFRYLLKLFTERCGPKILESTDNAGYSPLLSAVPMRKYVGQYPVALTRFEYLRDLGASCSTRNSCGQDVIWLALKNAWISDPICLRIVQSRLEGMTSQEQAEVVSASVSNSGDVTALMMAAKNLRPSVVALFLKLGVDADVCSVEGSTALDYALETCEETRQEWAYWLMNNQLDADRDLEPLVSEDVLFSTRNSAVEQISTKGFAQIDGVSDSRDRFHNGPQIVHKLLAAGAKRAKDIIPDARKIVGPRTFDQFTKDEFENDLAKWRVLQQPDYEHLRDVDKDTLTNWHAEKQPFYEHWKFLYELMSD